MKREDLMGGYKQEV